MHTSIITLLLLPTQVDDKAKSAAKLAVHLLKQPPQRTATTVTASKTSSLDRSLSLGLGPLQGSAAGSGVEVQGIVASRAGDDNNEGLAAGDSSSGSGFGPGFEPSPSAAAGEGVAMSSAVEASADALDALVQLLEQYCHPSNTGSWSGELAVFLRHGVHYFMKVGLGVVLGGGVSVCAVCVCLGGDCSVRENAVNIMMLCVFVPPGGYMAWGPEHEADAIHPSDTTAHYNVAH